MVASCLLCYKLHRYCSADCRTAFEQCFSLFWPSKGQALWVTGTPCLCHSVFWEYLFALLLGTYHVAPLVWRLYAENTSAYYPRTIRATEQVNIYYGLGLGFRVEEVLHYYATVSEPTTCIALPYATACEPTTCMFGRIGSCRSQMA